MTEPISVYDLTYPSPITLKEISSIVVAVELWRDEICVHLESKRLHELDFKKDTRLENKIPNLPSVIYNLLEGYVDTFRKSITKWQKYHYRNVFDDSGSMNVLSRFHDFAWDWDGAIHEERTAKRMMLCDRFTEDEKFKIACLYCFEDDIKQIWPSVSQTKDSNGNNFRTCPQQYYWICYLRNELHKIPNPYNEPIDNFMIFSLCEFNCKSRNHSSVMYFWNRLPSGSWSPIVYEFLYRRVVFVRFILPKLNNHQLDILVAKYGAYLVEFLLKFASTIVHVLPTWTYIRSRIDISNFSRLIDQLLCAEAIGGNHLHSRSVVYLFDEIWKSAPHHFKRSVLDDALHDDRFFRLRHMRLGASRGMKFFITVLRDATFEERDEFWHLNWHDLIFCAPVEDFVVMMELSFQNENEITSFKETLMTIYENIVGGCASLLKHGLFEELNDFLSVCYLDEQKRTELKRRLLRSNYVGENSVFTRTVVRKRKLLNEFIDDAFQDTADLGVEFRNQLTSSPVTQNCLLECIRCGGFVMVMEFVDVFYPDEQIVMTLKKRFFEHFKEHLIAGNILNLDSNNLHAFLIWLLGNEDEVIRFKQSIPIERVFRTMMQIEWRSEAEYVDDDFKPQFPENVDQFLIWYFNKDEEEIEMFTKLFLNNEFKSFLPRKRRKIV
ncbi:uncharacterized protein LOC135833973 [Planococcus citri]|uniref:uncharacterized protein LOC135833973 n=1 Tax=Planococcus citri TaxID=170843 RepID=UPI0031F742DB